MNKIINDINKTIYIIKILKLMDLTSNKENLIINNSEQNKINSENNLKEIENKYQELSNKEINENQELSNKETEVFKQLSPSTNKNIDYKINIKSEINNLDNESNLDNKTTKTVSNIIDKVLIDFDILTNN